MENKLEKYEKCVCCHKIIYIDKKIPINIRKYYIEGAGQLCKVCYKKNI